MRSCARFVRPCDSVDSPIETRRRRARRQTRDGPPVEYLSWIRSRQQRVRRPIATRSVHYPRLETQAASSDLNPMRRSCAFFWLFSSWRRVAAFFWLPPLAPRRSSSPPFTPLPPAPLLERSLAPMTPTSERATSGPRPSPSAAAA